jgi:hypothetical protein
MKTIPITQAGAMILDSKYRIPELAKASLDKFANTRFKDLKYVTRAFKYQFPFYESLQKKRSFNKIFQILDKTLSRLVPYVDNAKVKFLSTERDSSEYIYIRIGPMSNHASHMPKQRALRKYCARLARLIVTHGLPIGLTYGVTNYVRPLNSHRYAYYESDADKNANTFEIYEIRMNFRNGAGENGYLLLLYAPEILKVLETLHRFAHYADSTYRTPR